MGFKHFFRYIIPWKVITIIAIYLLAVYVTYRAIIDVDWIANELFRDSIVIGLSTSLIGSLIFLLILWMLKPSIVISKKIAHDVYLEDMEALYIFKIINNSWFYSVLDCKVTLYKVWERPNDENSSKVNTRREKIDLIKEHKNFIPPRLSPTSLLNRSAEYAQWFFCEEDLSAVFNDDKKLQLEVYAKHSLSGFSKIHRRNYNMSRCIQKGLFAHGDNFNIFEH